MLNRRCNYYNASFRVSPPRPYNRDVGIKPVPWYIIWLQFFSVLVNTIGIMDVTMKFSGEMSVMYLFTRVRFNWDEVNYSMFSTYSMITNLVGSSKLTLRHTANVSMVITILYNITGCEHTNHHLSCASVFISNRYDVFGRRVQSHVANRRRPDRSDVVREQNTGWIRLRVCHHRFRVLFGLVL